MSLTLTTDSASEPIELDDVKAYLRIEHDEDDSQLLAFIKAARRYCEDVTGRQFVNATYTLRLDSFPGTILIPKVPLYSVTSVKYYNSSNTLTTLTAVTDYETDTSSEPARIRPPTTASWPATYDRYNAVEVIFVAGYGTSHVSVPTFYKQAIRLLVAHWYENRGTVTVGVTASPIQDTLKALLLSDRNWQF